MDQVQMEALFLLPQAQEELQLELEDFSPSQEETELVPQEEVSLLQQEQVTEVELEGRLLS